MGQLATRLGDERTFVKALLTKKTRTLGPPFVAATVALREYAMPYDDPTRPRTRPRPDKKPSLLDTLIPEPDHPLAMRRTLSVGVLTTFILLFLYECVAAAPTYDGAGGRVTRWMWGQSVSWGREVAAGGQLVVGPASQQYGIEDESDTTASAVVGASGTASSQSTPDWQRYVWHEDLKWKEGNGRLIVLGDIHGMVDSMQCVNLVSSRIH